jgi:hypothetical protein
VVEYIWSVCQIQLELTFSSASAAARASASAASFESLSSERTLPLTCTGGEEKG